MSRALTSAQIIEKGDYLSPDFDPSTLTISQLLGVFGFHNINFPSPYTKGKLVQIFNDELKPQSVVYKRERLSRQNSLASDDGITDGVTGRPINDGRRAPTTRMVTRRASRTPVEVADPEPERPEPPKRRRSSAEPRLGGPSRRRAAKPTEPVVVEESEPEEPVRKVGRNKKKTEAAGKQARRATPGMDDPDSGWEDNNIFQSGPESSPARPSPSKPRTRRVSTVRARKSMSVPPQFAPPPPSPPQEDAGPSRATRRRTSVKPPESAFDPVLPPEVVKPRSRRVTRGTPVLPSPPPEDEEEEAHEEPPPAAPDRAPSPDMQEPFGAQTDDAPSGAEGGPFEFPPALEPTASDELPGEEELDELSEPVSDGPEDEVTAVSQRIAEGGRQVARPRTQKLSDRFNLLNLLLLLAAAFAARTVYFHRNESVSIGFCNTGKDTNEVLEAYRARRILIQECNRANRTTLYPIPDGDFTEPSGESQVAFSEPCPIPSPIPFVQADACTPCPAHATCTVSTMTCETGFLLKPHPLLMLLAPPQTAGAPNAYTVPYYASSLGSGALEYAHAAVASLSDGLPGFGPVAFAPHCVEDPRRKRHIGKLGKAIESWLAAERGRWLCAGVDAGKQPGTEAEEARKWGMEIEVLKENMRRKTSPQLISTFEDTFNEAIQQLVVWGGVFLGEDANGKRYLAHHTPTMDLACTMKVQAREAWTAWRLQLSGLATAIATIMYYRRRHARNKIEGARVGELVQLAIECLRNQELAHHTDPVVAPQDCLSSVQLRDLVLQDEHSIAARNRLWQRVENIVESNSNVRTNLEEVGGGDEMRVWRWVGSAGPLSPGRGPFTPRREAGIP